MSKIKTFLKSNPKILKLLFSFCNILPFNNTFKGRKGNKIIANGLMQRCKIKFRGKNNKIEIHNGAILKNCTINISGNNNRVVFGEKSYAHFADLCTEDDNNSIIIGNRTDLCGKIHLAAIEGTTIEIGEDCLFSSDIVFQTGDSHSILDMSGKRTNPSKDIHIGNHVWVGHKVFVNKGVNVGSDNVIGTAAVVTKSISETNSIIVGIPAKVVKGEINWTKERIDIKDIVEE